MKANLQKRTCQFCRWHKIARGTHYLPFSHTDEAQRDVEFCCFNPPHGGLYPWSFGETAPDATCSKWEAREDQRAED